MNKPIRKVVILGGGSAGASALALLQEHFSHLAEIVLIDSADFPPVGVGEATVGNISTFLTALREGDEEIAITARAEAVERVSAMVFPLRSSSTSTSARAT